MIPPALSTPPPIRITLAIQSFLWFHIDFRNFCSISVKNILGILIGIALNLQIALGSMNIFIMLILPVHELGVSSHLSVSSPVSFNNVK